MRNGLLLGLVAAALAASPLACKRGDRAGPETSAAGAAVSARSAAAQNEAPLAPLDARTRGFELGKFYGYRVKLTTAIELANGPRTYDFDLTGTVGLIPVAVTPDAVTLHVSIPDAAVTSRIAEGPELDRLAKEMRETGAYFTLAAGKLRELFVPSGQGPMVSTTYRQVASALQFARAIDERRTYTTEEYDTSGRHVAAYELASDGRVWQKRKLRYIELLGAQRASADRPIPVVPEVVSESQVRLLGSGRPESVALNERVSLKGAQMPLSSTLVVELSALGESSAPANHAKLVTTLDRMHRIAADEPIGVAPSDEALDAARIGELDFKQILASLERNADEKAATLPDLDAEPKEGEVPLTDEERAQRENAVREDSRLFLALSALLRQKPATVHEIVKAIRAKSPASFALADALGNASSPAAQKALVLLIDEKGLDPKLHGRVINALTRTPMPTDASVAALKALLKNDSFNRRAIYGLGTYALRLRDAGETKRAAEIGEFLLTRLSLAKVPVQEVTVLRGIANSGYAAALPKVVPYLKSPEERVRVAAVRALQSMKDPQVDGILATRMQTDVSNDVRVSAIVASQQREPSAELSSGLSAVATDAADATVRFRAVELMTRWLSKRPDLRPALERVARQDREVRVRDLAKAAL